MYDFTKDLAIILRVIGRMKTTRLILIMLFILSCIALWKGSELMNAAHGIGLL